MALAAHSARGALGGLEGAQHAEVKAFLRE